MLCIMFCNCLSPYFSASLPHFFWNIGELGAKKCFADHRTATTIPFFVTIKGTFDGLFLFQTSRKEGEFRIEYLINVATCLFAWH